MPGIGFGPLGARAATIRPSVDADTYGVQTWFKNCSGANAADGTVPTASWFNHIIGNLVYAAAQAGVSTTNDQSDDTYIWTIIDNAITARVGTAVVPWGL